MKQNIQRLFVEISDNNHFLRLIESYI